MTRTGRPRHGGPLLELNQNEDLELSEATHAWLQAIHESTNCIRQANDHEGHGNQAYALVDESITYLATLEEVLKAQPVSAWNLPPTMEPPLRGSNQPSPQAQTTGNNILQSNNSPAPMNSNPFASLASDDDDEDLEEAGDMPVLNREMDGDFNEGGDMDLLRLLVRICTSLSDLWAHKGNALARDSKWVQGAQCLQFAIAKIRQALALADDQVSKWYQRQEQAQLFILDEAFLSGQSTQQIEKLKLRKQALEEDADIVHVAIESLIQARDRYLAMAHRRMNRINRILEPQWQSRDEVKERMGQERWTNNPAPKYDYAKKRAESEQELRQLKAALQELQEEGAQGETTSLENLAASAEMIKARLGSSEANDKHHHHRYNNVRPSETDTRRLPDFPDATDLGWNFTGSREESVVEFYDRYVDDGRGDSTLVKLDFYYTTGTVKLSKDKSQFFWRREAVSPELYVDILLEPLKHIQQTAPTKNMKFQKPKKDRKNKPRRNKPRGSESSNNWHP